MLRVFLCDAALTIPHLFKSILKINSGPAFDGIFAGPHFGYISMALQCPTHSQRKSIIHQSGSGQARDRKPGTWAEMGGHDSVTNIEEQIITNLPKSEFLRVKAQIVFN